MSKLRLPVAFLLLVAMLAATWGLANLTPASRIAYVDSDGVIRTVSKDGSGAAVISPDRTNFYTWPTWSPDARRLVYSGVIGGGDSIKMSLFVSDADGKNSSEIYAGVAGVTGLLAQGVIHYPLWSPSGAQVAFIAATGVGLTLFIDDLSDDPTARPLLDNGPLWISWSPDSRHLLAHRADEHFLVDTGDGSAVEPLGLTDVESRVPAWSPDGTSFITALRASQFQYHIFESAFADGEAQAADRLLTTRPIPAFLWSPDGAHFSIAHSSRSLTYRGLTMFLYGGVSVFPESAMAPLYQINEPTLAHFWSPDGKKLAYVSLSDTPRVLRWAVLNLQTGERSDIVDFVPSEAQLTMFQFFDQYAYSHSLWSPQSDALVFAGTLSTEAVTASLRASEKGTGNGGAPLSHEGEHIIVVDTVGERGPRVIADGFMATWSPK